MNLETLKKLVIQGESERLEFKKSTGERSDSVRFRPISRSIRPISRSDPLISLDPCSIR